MKSRVLTPRQSDPRSCFLYSLQIFVYDLVLTLDALVSQLYSHRCKAHHSSIFLCIGILWVTTQTQLFLITPKKKFRSRGVSGLSSLGRIMLKKQGLSDDDDPLFLPKRWQIFPRGCSARCPVDRSWCAQRCCELRRSCDGVAAATESLLRRSCADQLRRAHSARRVRDGADAAATELMLLRRS